MMTMVSSAKLFILMLMSTISSVGLIQLVVPTSEAMTIIQMVSMNGDTHLC